MNTALAATALLMGLAGAPHCAAMCGAACTGIVRGCAGGTAPQASTLSFHAARLASYAAGGALAAGSVSWLASQGAQVAVLRPLWTLLQVAALALGLWLLIRGRQPAWVENFGRNGAGGKRRDLDAGAGRCGGGRLDVGGAALRPAAVGAGGGGAGLRPGGGRRADGAVCRRLGARPVARPGAVAAPGRAATPARPRCWPCALAGLMLAGASGWALAHGLATAMGSDFCLPF